MGRCMIRPCAGHQVARLSEEEPGRGNAGRFLPNKPLHPSGGAGCSGEMRFDVTLIEFEKKFAAWCDDLPGCHSEGANREEALANLREAIRETLAARPQLRTTFGAKISREVLVFD